MVFIYALINPLTKAVFYIGASKHPMQRLKQHVRDSYYGRTKKEKVIKEILLVGGYVHRVSDPTHCWAPAVYDVALIGSPYPIGKV